MTLSQYGNKSKLVVYWKVLSLVHSSQSTNSYTTEVCFILMTDTQQLPNVIFI